MPAMIAVKVLLGIVGFIFLGFWAIASLIGIAVNLMRLTQNED